MEREVLPLLRASQSETEDLSEVEEGQCPSDDIMDALSSQILDL